MTHFIDEFNSFIDLELGIPLNLEVRKKENFSVFMNGVLPQIRDSEFEKIGAFLSSNLINTIRSSKEERKKEIERNIFTLPNEILDRYLNLLLNRLNTATKHFPLAKHFKEFRNSEILEINKEKIDLLSSTDKTKYFLIGIYYVSVLDCCNCYYELITFIKEKQKELISIDDNLATRKTETLKESSLTHREHALIYKYKADAGYLPNSFNGTEIEKTYGAKRKQAFYSIWHKKGDTFKTPRLKELKSIEPHLVKFERAHSALKNDIDSLEF